MPLDRQDIERSDFPTGRRGYQRAAVDAHLRRVADEVAELGRARPAGGTLAGAASGRVQAIVEAAETSAAEIQGQAEDDAAATREQAAAESRAQLATVSEAARSLLARLEQMTGELDALSADLRPPAGAAIDEPEPLEVERLEPELLEVEPLEPEPEVEPVAVEPEPEPVPVEPEPEPEPASPPSSTADEEGARLIALNMAFSGTPREETDRYLAENFDVDDRDRLLDEVYSRV